MAATPRVSLTIQSVRAKKAGTMEDCELLCFLAAFTDPVSYTNDRGEVRHLTNIALCDETGIIKGTIFNDGIVKHLKSNRSYLVQNFILKEGSNDREDDDKNIVLTLKSKMMLSKTVKVPDSTIDQAKLLVFPPPPPISPLNVAKFTPPRKRTSIAGTVVSVSFFLSLFFLIKITLQAWKMCICYCFSHSYFPVLPTTGARNIGNGPHH